MSREEDWGGNTPGSLPRRFDCDQPNGQLRFRSIAHRQRIESRDPSVTQIITSNIIFIAILQWRVDVAAIIEPKRVHLRLVQRLFTDYSHTFNTVVINPPLK
jgi:hypothetical protein